MSMSPAKPEHLLKAELAQKIREQEAIKRQILVRRAIASPYLWLTEATKSKDEQAAAKGLEPFRPFPKKLYIRHLLDAMDYEKLLYVEKSRTMMGTWTMAGWAAHRMFTRPATTVVVISKDWDRALKPIEYMKVLWRQSIPELRALWKPLGDREIEDQAAESLYIGNGSWALALPGDPNKIRFQHSSIILMDEAAHIVEGKEAFNVARATRAPNMVVLSSQAPGWFREATADATPVDWPDYSQMEKAA